MLSRKSDTLYCGEQTMLLLGINGRSNADRQKACQSQSLPKAHTIHLSKNLKRLLESRLQAFLLGDVGLDVQRLAAESRRPGVEFLLFDDFGLDVPDGDVATHFADCARDGEADTLGAARDDVGAVCEFEGGADGGDHFGWRRGTRGLCLCVVSKQWVVQGWCHVNLILLLDLEICCHTRQLHVREFLVSIYSNL
jgi:hypothetical protein